MGTTGTLSPPFLPNSMSFLEHTLLEKDEELTAGENFLDEYYAVGREVPVTTGMEAGAGSSLLRLCFSSMS